MIAALRFSLAVSCILLAAAAGHTQTLPLTQAQRSALEARAAELAGLQASGSAQAAEAPAAGAGRAIAGTLNAQLVSLSESRVISSGRGSVSLSAGLTFTGVALQPGATIRRVTITRAVDDRDRPLSAGRGTTITSNPGRAAVAPGMRGNITLGNSSRDAQSIKVIEGEVEMFVPSVESGSVIRVSNLASNAGKTIENPALRANGIEITVLDRERFAALALPRANQPEPDFATSAYFYVRDATARLVSYEFQDAAGGRLGTPGSTRTDSSGTLVEIKLGGPIPEGAQVVLQVAVPEALKIYTFRLENIPLP